MPLVWPRGGKAPGLPGCAPLGRRALAAPGENVGDARGPVHAGPRLQMRGRAGAGRWKERQIRSDSGERRTQRETDRAAGSGMPFLCGLGCLAVVAI